MNSVIGYGMNTARMTSQPGVESPAMTGREKGHLALLCAIAAFLLGWGIERPLYHSDESRYAQIGWQIWEGGHWIMPRLEGSPYIDKPPLHVWCIAVAVGALGHGNIAPRLVSFLSALALVPMLYFAGRRKWGHAAGLWAGIVWMTSAMAVSVGRGVAPDMLLGVLVTGAILSFWRALDTGKGAWLGWVLSALAFLTKGPIAFFIAAMAGVGYAVFHRQFSFRKVRIALGIPLCLLVLAPWAIWTYLECPQFYERFFINQNLGGFKGEVHHPQPFWATSLYAIGGMAPWSLLLIPAMIRERGAWKDPAIRFLLFWGLTIVVFFSISVSKLATYVVPAMPAFSLIFGVFLSRAVGRAADAIPYVVFSLGGAGAVVLLSLRPTVNIGGTDITVAKSALIVGAVSAIGYAVGAIFAARGRLQMAAFATVCTGAAMIVPGLHAVRDYCDVYRSSQYLLERNLKRLGDSPIVLYKKRDYSVTYYLRRQAHHIGMPGELEYGIKEMKVENRYILPDHGLREFLDENVRAGVVTSPHGAEKLRTEYPDLIEVDREGSFVLFVTRALK